MKKIVSFLLTMFLTLSVLAGSGTAYALSDADRQPSAENPSLSYCYDPDKTAFIVYGGGKVPDAYLGWTWSDAEHLDTALFEEKRDSYYSLYCHGSCDYVLEFDGYEKVYSPEHFSSDYYTAEQIFYNKIYPSYYANYSRFATKLVVEEGITSIGTRAFSFAFPNVTSVKLPSTLKTIKSNSFEGMKLESIVIPSSVTSLSSDVFKYNCGERDATNIIIPGKNTDIDFAYTQVNNPNTKPKKIIAGNYTVLKGSKAEATLKKAKYQNYKTIAAPGKVSNIKLAAKSKGMKVSWKKKNIKGGYQIQIAANSKFTSGKKTITVSNATTATKTIKSLKGKKKYYVRVRAYKTYKGAKFYGAWSKAKTITTKK